MVDKNLFLYDLAVVAIMKNEAPYVKEWLDYYLAAGVDHFYIYDNESSDNFNEVLQPYIDAGIVTYKFYPGTRRQVEAYIEAYKTYRFFCRYMAFIDADEFIFPQSNKSISEVADEFFDTAPNIGALEINWMMYGSNNLETADYSKGILERFTRRAANYSEKNVKTVANPRKIDYITTPHYMYYFAGIEVIIDDFRKGEHAVADKILINHYQLKSREEFLRKNKDFKGDVAYGNKGYYRESRFSHEKDNDIFDDSILAYRDARRQMGGGTGKPLDYERLINALILNLAPILRGEKVSEEFFSGKMETFLTCRALATYLKENVLDEARGKILEQASLQAIYKTSINLSSGDVELLLSVLPELLMLNYPIVQDICRVCIEGVAQIKNSVKSQITDHKKMQIWKNFNEYDNFQRLLQGFNAALDSLKLQK